MPTKTKHKGAAAESSMHGLPGCEHFPVPTEADDVRFCDNCGWSYERIERSDESIVIEAWSGKTRGIKKVSVWSFIRGVGRSHRKDVSDDSADKKD